jgi:hypothetical protein
MLVGKASPPVIGFEHLPRCMGMLERQFPVSERRMALSDIEMAEGVVGIFVDDVLQVMERNVITPDLDIVVFNKN